MLIHVNGESREVLEQVSVQELLLSLAIPSDRVAIELNERVIRRAEWRNALLHEGDKLEIVHFVGGGGSSLSLVHCS